MSAIMWTPGIPLWLGLWLASAMLAQAPQQPVFRSGVDLVTVDVTVVDDGGRQVEDLTADQFEIKVDGTPRRVVRAVYVPYKVTASRAASVAGLAPYVSSNEEADPGRLMLIAVDQRHIRRVEGLAALRAAASFIDQLDRSDRVAAAPLDHIGPVEFTNRHASVKAYLQTLAGTATSLRGQFSIGIAEALAVADGQRSWLDRVVQRECGQPIARFENQARIAEASGFRDPCPVQVEQESRALAQELRSDARTTLNQMLGLVARLADIDGPKTLVLVSEGLIAEPQLIDLTSLGAAAQAARVSIYVLQLEQPVFDASETIVSPTLYQDLQLKADGLVRLAGSARGAHFRLVGADPYPFKRILRELSGYYLLAFEAAPADRDGRTRRIDVSTSARGAVVRARPAFRASTAPPKDGDEKQIVRLLRAPRIATELPVRATTSAFRDSADGRTRVILAADADGGSSQPVTFGYVLVNDAGVIAASGSDPAPEGRFSHAVSVAPGRYTLKVAAIDATGRQGSVERAFDARLHGAGSLGISDLTLTDSEPGHALRPIVARANADSLGAVIEIYSPTGSQPVGVSVVMDVKESGSSTPVLKTAAKVVPVGASTARARADLKLGGLPPGSYVVTAHVQLPDGTTKRVERVFVK
jgi:VWFA-related protein